MPYKLVTGKITKPSPIPGLNLPGRMKAIVSNLFSRHQIQQQDKPTRMSPQESKEITLKMEELETTTRSLKSNTAPGPDGIRNEVLKCFSK